MRKYRANALTANVTSGFGLKWKEVINEGSSYNWEEHVSETLLQDENNHEFVGFSELFDQVDTRRLISEV